MWSTLSNRLVASTRRTAILSFILGLGMVFAYAPFSLWPLAIILPALWLPLLTGKSPKAAAQLGASFGFGWFVAGISWVFVSIDQFGGLPVPVSLLLIAILCAYLALYPALACYLVARLSPKRQFEPWLLPPVWLFAEYLRSVMLTGFPWLSLGYSQINGPLARFAPVIGETGITLMMLILSVAMAQLIRKQAIKKPLLIIAIVACCTWVVGRHAWISPAQKTITTALIQGNIQQDLRWVPEHEWPTMLRYLDLTRANYDADLIIWPEAAVPSAEPMAQDYLDMVNRSAKLNNTSIITGIINYNFETKQYFNSLIVLGNEQQNDTGPGYYYQHHNRYSKYHLLPIGEFVPFQKWLRPLAPLFNLPMSSFSRGDYVQDNLLANGLHIAPLICFEIAFPEQLRANFNDNTDLILTVSNDAWFGDSHGPHQHLEIAQMRALEFGRPVLRATNNGVTAIIDAQGQISAQLPQFQQQVLKSQVSLTTGRTPFSRWGHWPSTVLALVLLLSQLLRRRI